MKNHVVDHLTVQQEGLFSTTTYKETTYRPIKKSPVTVFKLKKNTNPYSITRIKVLVLDKKHTIYYM